MEIIKILVKLVVISSFAVGAVFFVKKRTSESKTKEETYLSEGMAIGMCMGTSVGMIFGKDNLVFGMMLGMMIGISYSKK